MFEWLTWSNCKNVLSWIDKYAKTIQALLTSLAIIIAGIWTYNEFIRERTKHPRLNISQSVETLRIPEDQRWVQIRIHLENIGRIKIDIGDGFTKVQQILPVSKEFYNVLNGEDTEKLRDINERRFVRWPMLCKRKFAIALSMEPGEKFTLTQDFFIPQNVKAFRLYTFVTGPNSEADSPRGWAESTIYEVENDTEEDSNEILRGGDSARRICVIHK